MMIAMQPKTEDEKVNESVQEAEENKEDLRKPVDPAAAFAVQAWMAKSKMAADSQSKSEKKS